MPTMPAHGRPWSRPLLSVEALEERYVLDHTPAGMTPVPDLAVDHTPAAREALPSAPPVAGVSSATPSHLRPDSTRDAGWDRFSAPQDQQYRDGHRVDQPGDFHQQDSWSRDGVPSRPKADRLAAGDSTPQFEVAVWVVVPSHTPVNAADDDVPSPAPVVAIPHVARFGAEAEQVVDATALALVAEATPTPAALPAAVALELRVPQPPPPMPVMEGVAGGGRGGLLPLDREGAATPRRPPALSPTWASRWKNRTAARGRVSRRRRKTWVA